MQVFQVINMTNISLSTFQTPIGELIAANAEVLLKREGWAEYKPIPVGTKLYANDLLQPLAGAKAKICHSGSEILRLPDNQISSFSTYRPHKKVLTVERTSRIIAPRSGLIPFIPYIISPRLTQLLNPRPRLRWNPVSDATAYQVAIETSQGIIWQANTEACEVTYPGTPFLKDGIDYWLTVEANSGTSSKAEGMPTALKFRLLDEQNAEMVREAIEQINQQDLTPESKALTYAFLYRSYDLKTEAIEALEILVKGKSRFLAAYRSLAELYQEIGLLPLAEISYLEAVKLTALSSDLEGEALTYVGLGDLCHELGYDGDAIAWWKRAQEKFKVLGDQIWMSRLEAWFNDFWEE